MPRPEIDASPAETRSGGPSGTRSGGRVDVLGDVVDLYLRTPTHERGEIRAFADLVDGLLDGASLDERRRVALALAPRADTPPSLARRLAQEPIEIAEAMIVQSPVLTSRDLVDVMRCGPAHVRCVGRRLDLAPDIAAVLVDDAVEAPLSPPERAAGRRRGDSSAIARETPPEPVAPAAIAEPRPSPAPASVPLFRVPLRESAPAMPAPLAETAEERSPAPTLPGGYAFLVLDSAARWRALQAAALDVAIAGAPMPVRLTDAERVGERLLAAAVAGDRAFFADALAEALDLAPALVDAILEEQSGEALAVLLVACGLGEIRSTSILLHHLGSRATVGALQDLAALVDRTARRTAERLVASWREEKPTTRHTAVLRQTDPADRREATAAREARAGEARPARHTATRG